MAGGPDAATMTARAGIFFALLVQAVGQSFLHVTFPPLGRQLGFSDLQTAGVLSLSALLVMVAAPGWGHACERIGRRPVLLIALASITGISLLLAAIVASRLSGALGFMTTLVLLFSARALQVTLASGLLPAAQAHVADTTAAHERVNGMGFIGAAYGLGAIGGACLAWLVGAHSVVEAFVLLAVFGAAALVLVARGVRDVHHPNSRGSGFAGASALPLIRVWPFILVTLLSITTYSMVQQVAALRLQDVFGLTTGEAIARAGAALMITALTMCLVQLLGVRHLRWRPELILLAGAVLAALALLLCGTSGSYVGIAMALAMFGAGLGLMLPGNLASLSLRAGAGAQGKVAGINLVGQGLGLAIGPLVGAGLHAVSPSMPFLAGAALLALSAMAVLVGGRHSARPD